MSSEWDLFVQRQRQQEQEAEQRAREQEAQQQLSERQRLSSAAAEQARIERKRQREAEKGRQSCQDLEQEARTVYPIYTIVESTKGSWEGYGVPIHVTPFQKPRVELNDDGTTREIRSEIGWNISYSYNDVGYIDEASQGDEQIVYESVPTNITITREMEIGLGFSNYFFHSDSSGISRSERDKGVKVYIIQGNDGGIYWHHYAVALPTSQDEFFGDIYKNVEYLKPGNFLPQANERVRELNNVQRPQTPPQSGRFRRLFKRG